ncbi:MAG: globin domain-containing protein [Leptospirillia bacterium]
MEQVIESYKRVTRQAGFLDTFYQHFFSRDPDIPVRFKGVDMENQAFLLARSLAVILRHVAGVPGAEDTLAALAKRHGPTDLDIPERLYEEWKEALLLALEEFDPEFDQDLDTRWRNLLDAEVAHFIRMSRL